MFSKNKKKSYLIVAIKTNSYNNYFKIIKFISLNS